MKLDRIIAVNWGHMPPEAYEMGDLTMLSGANGSGKSTLLDGVQSVLTGVHRNIVQYNPGQKETGDGGREKTKRSLESYIVGADYNQFARPEGAQGYIAGVFRPDAGETQCTPLTAIVAASARVEGTGSTRQAKLESFALFIVEGSMCEVSDFMPDPETGVVISVDSIGRVLRAKYPKVLEFHDKKSDYLAALYGRFRGKQSVSRDEAFQAAKAWVQSIAYRKIGSVNELVRDEILDFDGVQLQQDIDRISSLMKEVAGLRREGARLHDSAGRLDTLQNFLRQTAGAHEAHALQELFAAKLRLETEEIDETTQRQKVQKNEDEKVSRTKDIAARTGRKGQLDSDRTTLKAQMLGIPAQQQKVDLENRIRATVSASRSVLMSLSESLLAADVMNRKALALLEMPHVQGLPRVNVALEAVAQAYPGARMVDLQAIAPCLLAAATAEIPATSDLREVALALAQYPQEGLGALYESLAAPVESLQAAVTQERVLHESVLASARNRVLELQARKATLTSGKVEYPRQVEHALERIREEYPKANPQVLCDLVEPKSDEWQSAIEGYLGGSRFNIVVAPVFETQVLAFVRRQNWRDVKVVQGKLSLAQVDRHPLPRESIVHELTAGNEIACAYLVTQYGSVLKVSTPEELQNTSRGLMQDGRASGGRTYFLADVKELVFGQRARQRQLAVVTQELGEAELLAVQARDTGNHLLRLQQELAGLKAASFEPGDLAGYAEELDAAQRALAALDLTKVADMEARLTELDGKIGKIDEANIADERLNGAADEHINSAKRLLTTLLARRDNVLAAVQTQLHRVGELAQLNPALSYEAMTEDVVQRLKQTVLTPEAAREAATQVAAKPLELLTHSIAALGEFNQFARAEERYVDALPFPAAGASFDASYQKVLQLQTVAGQRLQNLKGMGLYNNQLELENATRSFNDVFTKHFCLEIKTRVEDGMRTLRQMNNELRNLKFGQDSFSIDWSHWEPELREYFEFFEAVAKLTESTEHLDLFGDNELSAKHHEIRDRLASLLLDEDQERANKELRRIADYRNYRRYDIISTTEGGAQVRLSEWGTGSGGQLETPAYIVRAAVVTNRLKMFDKGPSLKLLANDEAFTLMDEARARAVLRFMADKLNLQVISAMPTLKAGPIRDEFNREYMFSRIQPVPNGELQFMVDCEGVVYKQDKMRELWERQRTIAREQARQLFEDAEAAAAGASLVEAVPAK